MRIAPFVEWPAPPATNLTAEFVIGVLGDDPFGPHLRDATATNRVRGASIVIKSFRNVEEVKDCQILFISASEKRNLPRIFAALRGRSILTVGDMEDFATAGGVVHLVAERTVRFQINLDAAMRAGLRISSLALQLAQIVHDPPSVRPSPAPQ